MPKKPDFNDSSWDTTFWSLWGLIYTGAASDTALKTAVTTKFTATSDMLGRLGPQVNPLAKKVKEWKAEVESFGRTITYGEANGVLLRLGDLFDEISQQVTRDELAAKAGTKPAKKKKKATTPTTSVSNASGDEDDISAEDSAWVDQYQNTIMGHSAATAKAPPKIVATPYVPPTPAEIWRDEQRSMGSRCDNGIAYGTHDVDQASVLSRLNLAPGDGSVRQFRLGSENSHERSMVSGSNVQWWTLGLTHKERRDAGNFSVYRRTGANTFVLVSGLRHPKDPGP